MYIYICLFIYIYTCMCVHLESIYQSILLCSLRFRPSSRWPWIILIDRSIYLELAGKK